MIYLNDDIAGFDLQAALPMLSAQRLEQLQKFKHELGRKTCAMAYVLLRQGLEQEYGLLEPPVFNYNEYGKPYIAGHPDIHFNLSHCRAGVICALSNRPVGIDIESVREYNDSLARYTMNEQELQLINASEHPDLTFIRLWTMKEAVLKWNGSGITNNIKDALEGVTGIETTVNEKKGYVYSVYPGTIVRTLPSSSIESSRTFLAT